MFQFPAFASYPYVFRIRYLYNDPWKPHRFYVSRQDATRTTSGAGKARRATFGARRPQDSRPEGLRYVREDKTSPISQGSKVGCPIRRSPDQGVFAPPRSLSQRITSFIACACQGIHQMPLRHLIVLIANDHRGQATKGQWHKKTSFSRSYPVAAAKGPIILRQLMSVPARQRINNTKRRPGCAPDKSSLHDITSNRQGTKPRKSILSRR